MEIIKKHSFEPDYRNTQNAARNIRAERMPLYEHLVGGRVIADVTGTHPYDGMY